MDKLEELVNIGTIKSYSLRNVDEDGNIDMVSSFRNTEQLTIEFHNGKSLTIDCLCSGTGEDTLLFIS